MRGVFCKKLAAISGHLDFGHRVEEIAATLKVDRFHWEGTSSAESWANHEWGDGVFIDYGKDYFEFGHWGYSVQYSIIDSSM